ncbi:MAG: TM1802 family CRISPR-associated protein, partial [Thermosediminibacteraceae bacterium]|nr:TM1802 family CRISPR-associated protein [Thermosediminibacteraceae bacterium]
MIEAIKILGESMLKTTGTGSFLSSLIDQISADRYIVIFDFKTDGDIEIKIDTWGVDAEKLDKVKWVGNVKGNNPQDRLTTDNLQ